MEKGIEALQRQWSAVLPTAPFEYHFMDDALKLMYQTEIRLKKASYTATVLTLVIVLLGVIGLLALGCMTSSCCAQRHLNSRKRRRPASS